MKRKVCLLFTFVVMMCLMACLSINVSAAEIESTGQCGENAYWSFDESTGTLTISGTGKIDDAVVFDEETGEILFDENTGIPVLNMPWYHLKNHIQTIVIEEGITEIGACAFHSFYYLTEVDFTSTLEVVGCGAFCDCIRLEELDFPDSVHTLYVSNYNEIAIKRIVLPASLETTPTIPGIDGIFDFNRCAYLESVTVPKEIGAIEAVVDITNPSIRNIYNYSTEALIKFDDCNVAMWSGNEAVAEYLTVTMGAGLELIEYPEILEDEDAKNDYLLNKIIEYYGEDFAEKIPYPNLIDSVPDYIKVYCYENSAQHLYCVENNINFVLIDENTHLDSDNDGICDICDRAHMCGEKVYYEFDDVTGTLTIKGEGKMYDYTYENRPWITYKDNIKSVVIGDGVTSIGYGMFFNCSNLEIVTIPDSIITIEDNLFRFCNNLTSITIGNSVTIIGAYAFDGCNSLTSITIPNSVTTIRESAFYNCNNLTNIRIPDSVTLIGDNAFHCCNSLTSIVVDEDNQFYSSDSFGVLYDKNKTELIQYPIGNERTEFTIPDSVTAIGNFAFYICESLASVKIPDSVTTIGDRAFYCCNNLTSIVVDEDNQFYSSDSFGVLYDKNKTELIQYPIGNERTEFTIPCSVTIIGDVAFGFCVYLTKLKIPDSVTSIGCDAFIQCQNFTSITIPNSVTIIGDGALSHCFNLSNMKIPDSVTTIGDYTFEYCYSLTSIIIPNSVTNIGSFAFNDCTSLADVYYSGTKKQWNEISIADANEPLVNATIHFNYDGTEPIITKSGSCGENVVFELYSDGTLIIDGEGPMYDYGEIEGEADIVFPPYVNYFYDEADEYGEYSGDFDIKKVIIKDGVTRIGNYAFQACRNLEEVEIADTVTSIGTVAFDFCTSLKHIKIPGSVKVLEQEAFSESALETIEIENGLERIEMLSFLYCQNLREVVLPESVEHIGECAFIICDNLEKVVINNKNCEIAPGNFITFELDEYGYPIEDEDGFEIEILGEGKYLTSECPTTLKGYSGSTAETYAKSMTEAGYPIKFESIDVHTHLDSDKNGKCDICGEIFIVDEGNCGAEGDNVTWTFYSDGKLVISGNGAMADNFFEFSKLDIKNVIIESGVTTIGGWAFARCDELLSIEIPDTVTSIGDSAFSGCESLTAVTIPTSVTTIGKAAFFNCKNLGSVAIPAGITSISELSFCGCKNLTNVSIKKSVTAVGKTAFDGCVNLESVYYDGTAQDWDKITIKSGNDPLINATKIFGDVCRHTEDGHETITTEEIIDEPTFFDDGSYVEITKCKNCGAELSREIKTIPDVSLLDTIAEEIEEFFKGPISAIANLFKRILRIFGKR